MDKSYVILGKGYVGQTLAAALRQANKTVHILSRGELDYTNPKVLRGYLTTRGQQDCEITVINCAGFTGSPNVDACELPINQPKVYSLNAQLPLDLAMVCKSYPNVNLIHISSGCIYDGYEKIHSETDTPNFGFYSSRSSFYSKTKHLSELLLQRLEYGCILRVRMIFGQESNDRNFLNKVLKYKNHIANENSMTSVEDLCQFIIRLTEMNAERTYGVYNVVNEGSISLKVIAGIFNKYPKFQRNWVFVNEADLQLAAKRSNCVLDTAKIRELGLELPSVIASLDKCISLL